ncbi:SAM-dependent methyltransferase [Variovorax paradoxus]|jgi:SAM-dependent methyltransferase|uniref:class I SAM-dependent methyltransferase n=1 Tax=Variovorax paradoxus TaxID=34073 RepID=UPI0006E6E9FF|nr:SAM-dependent methyltransferase [Variovorax paradoxus]KPV06396.1 SAM-dependent methyltransferase [Variovorax paradoxus]KPV10707.1 SAM-dependent methyltransferase [Variovorax paradoxus]KPV22808.1 SAM-dependent methyltransferase [Variovorax paradoxus]KPV33324.1 SAM-dependent methyltransferase [Variovorax paradoxus]
MHDTQESDSEQSRLWNGPAGRAWVDRQPLLDRLFAPLGTLLIESLAGHSLGRVLDVGCGTGAVTLALASPSGDAGECVGIDISAPMIEAARARAEREGSRARFVCADAQAHAFAPAGFDTLVSRLGVMFFDDPVAAFANLRRAARDAAALRFLAWRAAAENPFMTTAERAAAPLLPRLPARRPGAPGQFGFADRERVESILAQAGWGAIAIRPVDLACSLPARELVPYLSRLGPVGLALEQADAATRDRVIETVRAAFEPFVQGDEVRFTAACWLAGAQAASAARPA